MPKAILRVVNTDYPEETSLVDCIFDERLRDCMKLTSKAQANLALRHPERYRGVFLDTLKVRTNREKGAGFEFHWRDMGNGVEIVIMAKDRGLPVIVLSEANARDDPEIIKMLEGADAIFEKPYNAEQVQGAIERYFG